MHHHLHSLYSFGYTPCNPPIYLVSNAGTVKGYKVATISQFADKSAYYCRYYYYFYRLSLYCCIASYAIAIAFLYTSSLHASIQFSVRFQGIRHRACIIGRVYPYSTLHYKPSPFTNFLAIASSLPFLIRREHFTKTNTSRILLFDTRRAQTSKRSNLEA